MKEESRVVEREDSPEAPPSINGRASNEENEKDKEDQAMDDALSEMSFDTQSVSSPAAHLLDLDQDPSASFVLPTLDFSATFPVETGSWARTPSAREIATTPMSDLEFHNAWTSLERDLDATSDTFSDSSLSDVDSDGWGHSPPMSSSSRRSSSGSEGWVGLGFSSRFTGRMQDDTQAAFEEPRESMF